MKHNIREQDGNVLVVGLIFVMVLTILGVGSMQSSSLEYRMSTNTAFGKQAFESSETGRAAITQSLDAHIFGRGWTGVDLANGLQVLDKDSDAGADLIYVNQTGEAVDVPTEDAQFFVDSDSSGTFDATEKIAGVSIYQIASKVEKGNSIGSNNGYSGAGKGVGNGALHMHFQVMANGEGPSSSSSSVAVDYRYVAR